MTDITPNNTDTFLPERYRGILFNVLKIAIAAGLLLYIILKVNFSEIIQALHNADIRLIALTAALAFLNIFLQFYKWKITCNYLLEEQSNKKIFLSLFYGFSGGIFTPARIGEYFGRAAAFKNKPLLKVAVATFVDKTFVLMTITVFGSLASILFIHYYYNATIYLTFSLFILLFVLFYIAYLLVLDPKFWNTLIFNRIPKLHKLKKLLSNLLILKELDRFYALQMLVISIIFYTCFILQYALLAAAFTRHFNFLNYLWAGNLVAFTNTIIPPVSLGELGIREGASVFFLRKFGETASAAFDASIFLFVINILVPSVIGFFLLFRNNDN